MQQERLTPLAEPSAPIGRLLPSLHSLPAMPGVAREVLQVLEDPEASIGEIAARMAHEPGLTGRIVAAANTAFFCGQRPIYTVEDATVRLGLNQVRTMAVAILLGNRFNPRRCPGFDAKRYWFEALKSASAAGRLAQLRPELIAPDAAHLAGLLHNIGLLTQAYVFPEAMGHVFRLRAERGGASLAAVEREVLGFDRWRSGGELLRRWGMPEEVWRLVQGLGAAEPDAPAAAVLLREALRWSADNFAGPPDPELLAQTPEHRLQAAVRGCQRERERLAAFAFVLAQ